MASITYDYEASSTIPPARLFNAFILDDNLIPKILPQAIKSVEIVEGDGGVGTVKVINFGEASQLVKSAKHRVDALDKDNFTYAYTVTEGGLGDHLEKITCVIKIKPAGDGGSICKTISTYHIKGDIQMTDEQTKASKEKIKAGKEKALAMFKAVEAYLQKNPETYN